MTAKITNPLRYAAGAIFLVLTVWDLIELIPNLLDAGMSYNIPYFDSSNVISFLVLAVGLFLGAPIVCVAGCGIYTIYNSVILIKDIHRMAEIATISEITRWIVTDVMSAVALVAVLIALLTRRNSTIMGAIATALLVVQYIIRGIILITGWGIDHYFVRVEYLSKLPVVLLLAAGALLVCLSIVPPARKTPPAASDTVTKPTQQPTVSDELTRLTALKSLLDKGIISQEEFSVKKKQLLEK